MLNCIKLPNAFIEFIFPFQVYKFITGLLDILLQEKMFH